ncbi:hypothetical protein [Mycoplasmopsis pullorum]|uniref:hypothetical protein n=1 Tax=Mycoplasmopsis pullorum TaxID=48003 RepID=UPI00111A8527|nr:hypothetical protein [Mycoplasmopsis pullorum]TNK83759.1 hypothetical protein C4M93_01270 [Mycoplasmopsis pullorum]TNK88198.1 hypothetical protein C4M89_03220 [Mycoplasmopsis pullorum]TNK92562.1 hypothetical protein C4M96_00330 [Mycoplasmopsis pullorum]
MLFLEKIANKLNIDYSEFLKALEIENAQDIKNVLKGLDVYGLFQTKEELEKYINSKLANKEKEIQNLNEQKRDLIKNIFDTIDFKNKDVFNKLDFNDIDIKDVRNSILKQANKNNWDINIQETPTEKVESTNESPNIQGKIINGVYVRN